MVLVLAKMISGNFTVISGPVVENSAEYVYFEVNGIELIPDTADDNGRLLENKIWPKQAPTWLRVGVPADKMKPFESETINEDSPCWEVRL
jgi:hypothetical protein